MTTSATHEPVTVGAVCQAWLERGDELPEEIAVLEANQRAGVKVGDVLTWSAARRAYVTADGKFCVLAEYVRRRWLVEFCWPLPRQSFLFAS